MTAEPLAPSFGFVLYDAARLLRRDFDRRTRTVGLSRAKWSVLAHLARCEGTTQARLAEILDVSPITLTRQLDTLQREGLVERRPDPRDRRAYRLYLTDKAGPALDSLRELGAQTRAAALAGLSEAEQEQLVAMLLRVRENLTGLQSNHQQENQSV